MRARLRAPDWHRGGACVAVDPTAASPDFESTVPRTNRSSPFDRELRLLCESLRDASREASHSFETVLRSAHLRSEAEFLSVSVWCLLLGVVRAGYWVWIRERNSSSLASGPYRPAQPSIIARQLGIKCKFAPFRFGRGVSAPTPFSEVTSNSS